jgi:glycosyltransferase involved in cell wall biosynthesis
MMTRPLNSPIVSVIVPTKNRSHQIHSALNSISKQTFPSYECLIIDDNSDPHHKEEYRLIINNMDDRFNYCIANEHSSGGSGPSRARNIGIETAQGSYIAFCDDDDIWTRDDHLEVAVRALEKNKTDVFFADMRTVSNDSVTNARFYGCVLDKFRNKEIDSQDNVFEVGKREVSNLLRHRTVHCNTIVLRKELINRSGNYWEKICFAEDHDFCFRIFDASSGIVYRSVPVSDLNVSQHQSLARSYTQIERSLFGITACLHAETIIRDKYLRKALRDNQAWRLMELSKFSRQKNEYSERRRFSLRSLATSPSFSGLCEFVIANTQVITDFAGSSLSHVGNLSSSLPAIR